MVVGNLVGGYFIILIGWFMIKGISLLNIFYATLSFIALIIFVLIISLITYGVQISIHNLQFYTTPHH